MADRLRPPPNLVEGRDLGPGALSTERLAVAFVDDEQEVVVADGEVTGGSIELQESDV